MGVQVEFNPELCLREFGTESVLESECIPEDLHAGGVYGFLKNGQRNYWLEGEIPLRTTDGNQNLSRPIASVTILEVTHFFYEGKVHTKGTYQVNAIYDTQNPKIHFEGMEKKS